MNGIVFRLFWRRNSFQKSKNTVYSAIVLKKKTCPKSRLVNARLVSVDAGAPKRLFP